MREGFVVNLNQYISGGGEMGSLIREKDWEKTSLGEISTWPQSLLTTLNILLSSKFPMFLWWGQELVCFYNDSYRPSLGNNGKHPEILGQPAIQAWPEIWDTIEPLINQVMSGGESVWNEDQLVPIFRNGKIEDVYWTFSYSAVKDEGKNAGVLVVCTETTDQIISVSKIAESESKFRNLVQEAIVATSILTGKDFVIELANDESLKLWGKDKTVIGKPLIEAIPELKEQPYLKILDDVFTTGITYEGKENLAWLNINGILKPVYTNFIYKALFDNKKNIYGILVMGYDVSEQVLARNKIAEAEERTRLAIDAALLGTFDVDLITDEIVCSKRFCEIFGFPNTKPTHQQFVDAVHPDDLHIRNEANKLSRKTGHISYEVRIIWPDKSIHWINAQGKIFYDQNKKPVKLVGTVKDISGQKYALQVLEESEKKFRNTVMQAPAGIAVLSGKDFIIQMANETYLQLVDKEEKNFIGKPLFQMLPEVKDVVEPLLNNVLQTGNPFHANELAVTLNRYGKKELAYFNLVYQPLKEPDGSSSDIMVVATEVTPQVEARIALLEREKQFRNVVLQSPIAMAIFKGKDFVIDLANKSMLNIWRREIEDVDGKKLIDVFPELKGQPFPELLQKVFETGISHKENEAVAFVNGKGGLKKFYLDFEYAALYEKDAQISGIMATVHDVTEKVNAKKNIEESEKKFRILADSMPQLIWISDKEGFINYYSKAVYNYSGLNAELINKEGWLQIVHPDDRVENIKQWIHSISTGEPFLFEHRFRRYDGEYRWQLSRAIPQRDENGNIKMWVGTSTDIDDIKKHDQQKDDFIKMASHELKTPVTTIKGYIQLLLKKHASGNDNFLSGSLITIDKQVSKLTKLITDLLDVTKIETGSLEMIKEPVNISEKIKEIIKDIDATTQTHNIILHQHANPLIYADKNRIEQVVINLLTNAIKYSPNAKEVIVEIKSSDKTVTVSVKDFGIGINADDHEKVFERFYRVSGKDEKTFPGFGIGLFIVNEIIQLHEGKIWVESEKDKGSVFYFSIPVLNKN